MDGRSILSIHGQSMLSGDRNLSRCAMVVAHPAHLLTVLGMVVRFRPAILILTRAFAGNGAGQFELVESCLKLAGIDDLLTELQVDEQESYRRSLAHEFDFHASILPRVVDWLDHHQPDVVFGDAFELSNYQHDIGRFLLDKAIQIIEANGRSIANFEIPLSVQADEPGADLQFGRFLSEPFESFHLAPDELAIKQRVVETAMNRDSFVANMASHFPGLEIETFRRVPLDRDYLSVPNGTGRYYDQLGQQMVAEGAYQQAITFDQHFRPLVQFIEESVSKSRANIQVDVCGCGFSN